MSKVTDHFLDIIITSKPPLDPYQAQLQSLQWIPFAIIRGLERKAKHSPHVM